MGEGGFVKETSNVLTNPQTHQVIIFLFINIKLEQVVDSRKINPYNVIEAESAPNQVKIKEYEGNCLVRQLHCFRPCSGRNGGDS